MTQAGAMSAAVISSGIVAAHENALRLVIDAEVLLARERWPGAFAAAHFAREELAKIPLLLIAGVRVAHGAPVDWAELRMLMSNHKFKWRAVVSDLVRNREYLHGADDVRLREELSLVAYIGKLVLGPTFKDSVLVLPLWHDAVHRWGNRRFKSIYVDEGPKMMFETPANRIPPGTAIKATSVSTMSVRYYEPLVPLVPAFLEAAPSMASDALVFGLWMQLSKGGVGGNMDPGLLT